jgi:hypothetical protein
MSAFVNESADEVITLDREYCDPKPDGTPYHEVDTVSVRTQYGYGDMLAINKMGSGNPSLFWDAELGTLTLLARAITAWTFVDSDGQPIPIGMPMIRLLDPAVADRVAEVADRHYTAATSQLPNPSGAPSQPSSPERSSASANRAARRTARRSTPRSN